MSETMRETPLSAEEIAASQKRCDAATPLGELEIAIGRAYAHESAPEVTRVFANGLVIATFEGPKQIEYAELFVSARTDLPRALAGNAQLLVLRARIEKLRDELLYNDPLRGQHLPQCGCVACRVGALLADPAPTTPK